MMTNDPIGKAEDTIEISRVKRRMMINDPIGKTEDTIEISRVKR